LIIRLERDSYSGAQAVHISEDSSSNINPGTDENEIEKDNFHDSLGMDIDDFCQILLKKLTRILSLRYSPHF